MSDNMPTHPEPEDEDWESLCAQPQAQDPLPEPDPDLVDPWIADRTALTPAELVALVEDLRDFLDARVLDDTGVLERVDPADLTHVDGTSTGSPVTLANLRVMTTAVRSRDGRVGHIESVTAGGRYPEVVVRFPGPVKPLLDRCNAALPALREQADNPPYTIHLPPLPPGVVERYRRAIDWALEQSPSAVALRPNLDYMPR